MDASHENRRKKGELLFKCLTQLGTLLIIAILHIYTPTRSLSNPWQPLQRANVYNGTTKKTIEVLLVRPVWSDLLILPLTPRRQN